MSSDLNFVSTFKTSQNSPYFTNKDSRIKVNLLKRCMGKSSVPLIVYKSPKHPRVSRTVRVQEFLLYSSRIHIFTFHLKELCLEVNMNCGRNYKLNRGYELNAPRGSKYKKTKLIETTGHISTLPSTDFILTDVLVLPLILLNGFEDKVCIFSRGGGMIF